MDALRLTFTEWHEPYFRLGFAKIIVISENEWDKQNLF